MGNCTYQWDFGWCCLGLGLLGCLNYWRSDGFFHISGLRLHWQSLLDRSCHLFLGTGDKEYRQGNNKA